MLWTYQGSYWLISDLIPKKSEQLEFSKDFAIMFLAFKVDPEKRNFDIFAHAFPKNCKINFKIWEWEKYQNFVFWVSFWHLKNMVSKFFRNSNFSDFLGIKSEISHFGQSVRIQTVKLKIPGKLFLKVGCRTSVTFKL